MKKTKQTKHKPSTRLLTLLLVCTMVFTMMPGMVWADEVAIGSRAADGVIEVSSQEDLAKIGEAGGNYKLTADITLDNSWKEIDPKEAFTLDGNGHSITLVGKPLFNIISSNSRISNLILEGIVVETENKNTGSFARINKGIIRNACSYAETTYSGSSPYVYIAAIAGKTTGTIDNCIVGGKLLHDGKTPYYGAISNIAFMENAKFINCIAFGHERLGSKETLDKPELIEGENCTLITDASKFIPADYVEKMNTNLQDGDLNWAVVGGLLVPVAAGGETPEESASPEDIAALEKAIADAEAVDKTKVYTTETWDAFSKALENAKKVKNTETPLKKAVTSATTKLTAALEGLVKRQLSAVDFSDKEVNLIKTADDLGSIKSGKYYKLANDIVIGQWYFGFTNEMNAFVDGDGHTITLNGAPLWQSIGRDAVVQNLGIKGSAKSQKAIGAIAESCEGLIVNCWSLADIETAGNNGNRKDTGGLVAKLKSGGAIVNSYVAGKITVNGSKGEATTGSIAAKSEANSAVNNCYWLNGINANAVGDAKGAVNASSAKERKELYSTDFIALLNANKGNYGKTWAVSVDGFPYFGENHNYVPEGEGTLPANQATIAFTPNGGTLSTIKNQALTVDLNKKDDFGVIGSFSLPDYQIPEGGQVVWSCSAQNPEGNGLISEADGRFFVYKEGTLNVTAALKKANGETEFLAATKVNIIKSEIEAIQLYLSDKSGGDAEVIKDNKATVQGPNGRQSL